MFRMFAVVISICFLSLGSNAQTQDEIYLTKLIIKEEEPKELDQRIGWLALQNISNNHVYLILIDRIRLFMVFINNQRAAYLNDRSYIAFLEAEPIPHFRGSIDEFLGHVGRFLRENPSGNHGIRDVLARFFWGNRGEVLPIFLGAEMNNSRSLEIFFSSTYPRSNYRSRIIFGFGENQVWTNFEQTIQDLQDLQRGTVIPWAIVNYRYFHRGTQSRIMTLLMCLLNMRTVAIMRHLVPPRPVAQIIISWLARLDEPPRNDKKRKRNAQGSTELFATLNVKSDYNL